MTKKLEWSRGRFRCQRIASPGSSQWTHGYVFDGQLCSHFSRMSFVSAPKTADVVDADVEPCRLNAARSSATAGNMSDSRSLTLSLTFMNMLGASLVSLSYFVHMRARAESPTRKVAKASQSAIASLMVSKSLRWAVLSSLRTATMASSLSGSSMAYYLRILQFTTVHSSPNVSAEGTAARSFSAALGVFPSAMMLESF